jgi:hypothetical protein
MAIKKIFMECQNLMGGILEKPMTIQEIPIQRNN